MGEHAKSVRRNVRRQAETGKRKPTPPSPPALLIGKIRLECLEGETRQRIAGSGRERPALTSPSQHFRLAHRNRVVGF